ncbi:hypothetical protein [Christiangramia flava]|uniref:Uncharacterized protein n=1 Tax=Christiangramia flava JLT2011 TaxID=1229726 RepID=A0A1L7I137_9FLAO|nr:hypothetical protein [Christiangramia flava]APU66904.1 hypothetical protein GRFL_0180 [Christiangramia flava JLT2011]OSS38003.1 membrane protein [Christiangramia flava JLT2011]
MIDYILKHKLYLGASYEFLAMLSALWYYFHFKDSISRGLKLFILYLVIVFIVDTSGFYALWAYLDNYETIPALKDSPFARNFWLYNALHVIGYFCIGYFFTSQLEYLQKYKLKKILNILLVGIVVYSLVCYLTFGTFFETYDPSVMIIGTLAVVLCIMAYFFELLLSEKILHFRTNLLFYFAVVIMMWHLVITPINLYMSYTGLSNIEFRQFYITFLHWMNFIMYNTFAVGFFLAYLRRRKQALSLG